MKPSIFDSVDVEVVLYAAFMSTLISVLLTLRDRNRQVGRGIQVSSWATLIPDTLLGTLTGTALALTLPHKWPVFNSVTGIAFLAGFGGAVGPKLWDLISSDGLRVGFKALAGSFAGPLGKLADAASEAASTQPTNPYPPPPIAPLAMPQVATPPTPIQEAGEHDEIATSATEEVPPLRDESRPE